MNNGAFDGGLLAENNKALRAIYCEILQLCRTKEAIANGDFYDLMWANPHLSRQYFYLRHTKKEKLLFCLNFDAQSIETHLIIPQDAFNAINCNHNDFFLKPVFGITHEIAVNKYVAETSGVRMRLEAYQSVVFEVRQTD